MEFLRLLEGIRQPFLDSLFYAVTNFGGEIAFMVIAIVVFWCVSKKTGYYILMAGFFGTLLSQFLKLFFRIPRPWVVAQTEGYNYTTAFENKLGVEEAHKYLDAGGYSFPSGHTQNAVGTFGGLAVGVKKTWVKIVCILLALVVPFSRMYLGVHTPLDVGVAAACAVVILLVFYPLVMKSDEHPKRMYWLFGILLVCSAAYICYVNFSLSPAEFPDAEALGNYNEGVKNGWSLTGALLGLLVSYIYDIKKLHFEEKAPFWGQVCKVVLGLACVMAIRLGLSWLFGKLFPDQTFWNLPRYFLMVIMAGCIWPKTFPFWQKVGAKKAA